MWRGTKEKQEYDTREYCFICIQQSKPFVVISSHDGNDNHRNLFLNLTQAMSVYYCGHGDESRETKDNKATEVVEA